ncbi:ABC transporter related protein [Paenibacillus vortex V453]|uniref:ABC transporter related protein n=1 Tax=Paenibacillus vortex V453 TaxID=715225 RepID=A0A2R9T0P7_9BACL|nr:MULTISPECIES: ATP-binding cassette domain-containing protein [Paenibacillus]EFU43168.1 ABC transporter related protein [Paenibacillus vortex V453]MDH6671344.1 energy-coupling factor transport system ATP-binding protein [Paenibacillus sp. LBL]
MVISFEEVSYHYRDRGMTPILGLDGLNLELEEGRMIAVLGAPGSGKSTMLQHMNGLMRADEGLVRILDFNLESGDSRKIPPKLRQRVGLVFQYPEQQLFEDTVEKDLLFGPLNFGWSEAEAAEAVRRAAFFVGLDEALLAQSPFKLSSGQMRKAAVAAVLAADPDILALDEPTASLDPASREDLMQRLHGLTKAEGKTVIVVTHRLEELVSYADDFVVIKGGRVIFQGTARELVHKQEVLEEAGLMAPSSVRIAGTLAAQLGIETPEMLPDAAALAAWYAGLLESQS